MSDAREMMATAAEEVATVLDGVDEVDLGRTTPCTEFDLAALTEHFLGTTTMLAQAGRRLDYTPPKPSAEPWPQRLEASVRELAAAWSDPRAWEGEVAMGQGTMPAAMVGDMALAEILLHGWDVARACGRDLSVPAEIGTELRRGVEETAELGRQMHAYADAVPVPEESSDFDHALGAAGRNPAWRS